MWLGEESDERWVVLIPPMRGRMKYLRFSLFAKPKIFQERGFLGAAKTL
jgi:hypothetical protein